LEQGTAAGLPELDDFSTNFLYTHVGIVYACKPSIKNMNIMNTSNPFQIPVCLQRADSEQRRRERFKKGFIAVVAAIVVLLVGLLIEGCMTEKAANLVPGSQVTDFTTSRQSQPMAAAQKPEINSQLNPVETRQPAAVVANGDAAVASHAVTLYVVKPGDSLTRIARTHGTTVKALKAANSLDNDRIVVGAKLKIPTA
jgi:LysM repeat protein